LRGDGSNGKIIACCPALKIPRVVAQQSNFTFHDTAKRMEKFDESKDFLIKIKIPSREKKRIRKQLHYCGIDEHVVYPDLDRLANYVQGFYDDMHAKVMLQTSQT